MKNVFITGASGNVGQEVLRSLQKLPHHLRVYAGLRHQQENAEKLLFPGTCYKPFDFAYPETYEEALRNCDLLFLLRPPQLADVSRYFAPLIQVAKESGVRHIVFLSVQGVENNRFIPHHKIEKLIVDSGIAFTFLRPAYFMQNFTFTLRKELAQNRRIFLPAGKAKFTLIDVADVGEVATTIITEADKHRNKSYDLTGNEKYSFGEMAALLSKGLLTDIRFESPGLLKFYRAKRKEGVPAMFVLVMIMLHYLPRFQKEPEITDWVQRLTGHPPRSFERFIAENKERLLR